MKKAKKIQIVLPAATIIICTLAAVLPVTASAADNNGVTDGTQLYTGDDADLPYIQDGYYCIGDRCIYIGKDTTLIYEVNAFVTRLYNLCLDRTPDQMGLGAWIERLISGTYTGTEVARGFFFSDEMNNKNPDNRDFLDLLYRAVLGREPDEPGMAAWLSRMAGGMTKAQAFNGFADSDEFAGICNAYGIKP